MPVDLTDYAWRAMQTHYDGVVTSPTMSRLARLWPVTCPACDAILPEPAHSPAVCPRCDEVWVCPPTDTRLTPGMWLRAGERKVREVNDQGMYVVFISPTEWEECRRRWGDDPTTSLQLIMAAWWEKAKAQRIEADEPCSP